jgi:hypothetical protein
MICKICGLSTLAFYCRFFTNHCIVSAPAHKKTASHESHEAVLTTGAGERVRTVDLNLGKVALYQLSYTRLRGVYSTVGILRVKPKPQGLRKFLWIVPARCEKPQQRTNPTC